MIGRPRLQILGAIIAASAGLRAFDQTQSVPYVANVLTLTPTDLFAGIVDHTATGAATITLPNTDQIVAACVDLTVGDSFKFSLRENAAFAVTVVAGTGMTLLGTTAIGASFVRDYLVTMLSTARAQIYSGATVNGSATVTGMTAAQLATLQVGLAVSGASISGGTTILAISLTGPTPTLTLSAVATATTNPVALTFSPTCSVKGLGTYGI